MTFGTLDPDYGVVVACIGENTGDDHIRNLNDEVGEKEGHPGIGFAGSFANFVKISLSDKERLDLGSC